MPGAIEVPFFSATGAALGVDLNDCVGRVIAAGHYVLGPNVSAFEDAFAGHVGVGHAIGVANGTDALMLALRALGVGAGQRVVTVANAGGYASTAIAQVGAEAVYVDIEPERLLMSPLALQAALDAGGVAAVIFTHLYGQAAGAEWAAALCRKAGVPLVEDCAQAHGAELHGRRAGAWGDVACFSFYPTKNLGAIGDGGAVVTGDAALAARVRSLRQYGWGNKYRVTLAGGVNSRLDELQAAVLLAKLPRLDAANAGRRAIAARYHAALRGLPLALPPLAGADDVAHLYVVRTPRRDALAEWLAARGVASAVHYPVPDHRQPVRAGLLAPHLPETEKACAEVLSLPCYPGLAAEQVDGVIAAVRGFFDGGPAC